MDDKDHVVELFTSKVSGKKLVVVNGSKKVESKK